MCEAIIVVTGQIYPGYHHVFEAIEEANSYIAQHPRFPPSFFEKTYWNWTPVSKWHQVPRELWLGLPSEEQLQKDYLTENSNWG